MRFPAFMLGPDQQARLDRDAEADSLRRMSPIEVVVFCGAWIVSGAVVVYLVVNLWGAWP